MVPCPFSGFSNMCASGVCYTNGTSDLGVCTTAPKSHKLPIKCESSNDCTAMNSMNQTFQGQCMCGFNPSGDSYCSAHIGDGPGKLYIGVMTVLLKSGAMAGCQTARRHHSDCLNSCRKIRSKCKYLVFSFYEFY